MAEVLDGGLELVISEEIDWVSGGVKSLLEVWLEWVNNQSGFEVGVWCEYLSWVGSSELEWPVVDDNNLVVEVDDVNVGELLVELSNCLLCEVGLNEEVSIGHEEMWVWFLNVGLQWFL